MKAKELRKVFKWMLKYQEENNLHITEWTIGNTYLKFKEVETGICRRVKLDTITTE